MLNLTRKKTSGSIVLSKALRLDYGSYPRKDLTGAHDDYDLFVFDQLNETEKESAQAITATELSLIPSVSQVRARALLNSTGRKGSSRFRKRIQYPPWSWISE